FHDLLANDIPEKLHKLFIHSSVLPCHTRLSTHTNRFPALRFQPGHHLRMKALDGAGFSYPFRCNDSPGNPTTAALHLHRSGKDVPEIPAKSHTPGSAGSGSSRRPPCAR